MQCVSSVRFVCSPVDAGSSDDPFLAHCVRSATVALSNICIACDEATCSFCIHAIMPKPVECGSRCSSGDSVPIAPHLQAVLPNSFDKARLIQGSCASCIVCVIGSICGAYDIVDCSLEQC